MFSQFSSLSIPKFGFGKSSNAGKIDVLPVKVYNSETETDKRGRRLKHLLKLNHTNFSVLYNELRFHNHTPHLLGSAYIMGATTDQLTDIYEDEVKHGGHESWKPSPSEIALHDYRDYLGLKEYQRAWLDFFEDQLVTNGDFDWRKVIEKFLFEEGSKKELNPIPMIYCVVGGLGHPLIHLGYAYELNNRDVAMEAMVMTATCYDSKIATLLEQNLPKIATSTANPLTYSTSNPFEVIARVNGDTRLDGVFDHASSGNIGKLMEDERLLSIVIEHWSAWKVTDPTKQFQQSQELGVAILLSTAPDWGGHGYDFFLLHLLTTSHAVRILIPVMDPKYHLLLVRQWFLVVIIIYISQMRPVVDVKKIADIDIGEKGWQYTTDMALNGKQKFDAHYVKAIRAIHAAADAWGDDNSWYVRAAVKFAGEFTGWRGFGRTLDDSMRHRAPRKENKEAGSPLL